MAIPAMQAEGVAGLPAVVIVYMTPPGPVGLKSLELTVTERLSADTVNMPAGGVGVMTGGSADKTQHELSEPNVPYKATTRSVSPRL